jgi:hypothetical protein
MIDKNVLRMVLGGSSVEDVDLSDTLAIALATYFSDHRDRPNPDPEDESGWGEWVVGKTNAALTLITKELILCIERQKHVEQETA